MNNAFNFPPSSALIRLSGDRPLLLAFHANEYDRVPFETSISIPSNRSCFLSLSVFLTRVSSNSIFVLWASPSSFTTRCEEKKKNSLLVEHGEWRKVEGNERGKARPSCMPVNWSGERCWIGGPVVGVNVWNCFSRGHQEPFGVTWSRRALSGKAGGRGGGVKEALEINSQSLLPPPPWSGRSALYLPSTSLFLDPDLSARSGRPSPPIRPLVRSQTSRYECHLTSSIKGSHVSSERISQVPPYEYFYIIFYSRWSDVHTHTGRASHFEIYSEN